MVWAIATIQPTTQVLRYSDNCYFAVTLYLLLLQRVVWLVSGRFCFEDDEFYLSLGRETAVGRSYVESMTGVRPPPLNQRSMNHGYNDQTINSLKHRLLVYLHKEALKDGLYGVRRYINASYTIIISKIVIVMFFTQVKLWYLARSLGPGHAVCVFWMVVVGGRAWDIIHEKRR